MATYIIIKNALNGNITKIDITKKGGGMFMEIHGLVRNEYDNGFLGDGIADRKKHIIATVSIFKNGKRMGIAFQYTIQNKKIDFTTIELTPIGDGVCPHCDESDDIVWGEIFVDCDTANQECDCKKCGCNWHNVYKFAKVDIHV